VGLEVGYEARMRIIPDPLDALLGDDDGDITVRGIRTVKGAIDVPLA
jgi:hypothetical protein